MSKRAEIIISILCALILLTYIYVGFFAFPSGDDFDYACIGRKNEFIQTVLNERTRWNGRYFSNFLVIGSPLNAGGISLYQWMPAVLVSFVVLCSYGFFKLVVNSKSWLYALVSTVLCFSIMPDITEGIYWYTGAVSYIPAGALFMLSLGFLFQYWQSGKKTNLIFVIIIQTIASGFNEIIPILATTSFTLIWLFNRKRWDIALLTLFQFSLFYYVISAPGNQVRNGFFTEQHQVWYSFQKSWQYVVRFIGEWMLNPAIYLWALLLLKTKLPQFNIDRLSFLKKPIVIFFILVGPVYLGAFGPIWSTGLIGQYRTENLASYFFILGFTLIILVNKKWILEKLKFTINPKYVLPFFVLFLFVWKNQGVLFLELFNGEINAFANEMEDRIELLENSKNQDVYLPAIQHQSKTLFVYPITENPKDWKNQCYGNYYRTFKVYLKED